MGELCVIHAIHMEEAETEAKDGDKRMAPSYCTERAFFCSGVCRVSLLSEPAGAKIRTYRNGREQAQGNRSGGDIGAAGRDGEICDKV